MQSAASEPAARAADSFPDPLLELPQLTAERLPELDGRTFTIATGGFNYPVRLKLEPGADRLFIMFHGAVERAKIPLPAFARWNWGKILGGHVLAVCDPTLYLKSNLSLGWFVGTAQMHALPGLVGIAAQLSRMLRLGDDRTIYYGSSGGGFAAILAASMVGKNGRAIAVNPQTEVLRYHRWGVRDLAKALGSKEQPFALAELPGERVNALLAYQAASQRRQSPGIVIAQNALDTFHYENHYLPFVHQLGLQAEGEFNPQQRLASMLFEEPKGHKAGESKELVQRIRKEAVPFLLSESKKPWWRLW